MAVAKGARVAAGALLFTLDPTREAAALAEAASKLAQAESDLADLRVGSRPEELAAIEARLTDASAAMHLAGLTFERQRMLAGTSAASQAQLDSARAAAEADARLIPFGDTAWAANASAANAGRPA